MGLVCPMIKVMKCTRNGQTVFLLGAGTCNKLEHLKQEWRQIDLVIELLQERVQTQNRKIRVLYEKAPQCVKAACAVPLADSNRQRVDRFRVNFDDLINDLQNPNFILQDVPVQLVEREVAYALTFKDDPEFEEKYFDERSPKELRSITLNDFIKELYKQKNELRDDAMNMQVQTERVRSICELTKASRQLEIFNQFQTQFYRTDQPVVDVIKDISDESCAQLYEDICRVSNYFFEAFIGHEIIKSDPQEDLVIITDPECDFGIYQYMIGLGWDAVYTPYKDNPILLSEAEIDDVFCQRAVSEKILLKLQKWTEKTQQTVGTLYQSALTYLSQFNENQKQP